MISTKFKSISLIELLLAMGIFSVFMVGGLGFIVMGDRTSVMQEQNSKADSLVTQGLEVINFIKKTQWSTLIADDYGISMSGGVWILVPDQDVTDGLYTRKINISDVYRDDLENIVDGATGEIDPNTKKITVEVSWNKNGQVQTATNTSFITYWEQDVPSHYGGMMVYADFSGNDDILKYKLFNVSGTWSTEKTVPDFNVPDNQDTRRIEVYASPIRDEYILISKHTEAGQFIYAQVYNGATDTWGNVVQLAGYGDNTNPNTRNFDGAYLSDGRFLAVYDDFTYTPKSRIWNGTSWSSQSNIGNLGFLGYPVWMQVKAKPNSTRALYVVRDAMQRTITFLYNGSSWGSQTSQGTYSSGFSIENISIAWNRFSGNRFALMFNEASDNNPNIRIWNDSSSSWSSNVENVSVGSRAKIFEIADDPKRDQFLGCVKDLNQTIDCLKTGYTPSWTNTFQIASNTNNNEARSFSLGYESLSGELALAVYSEGATDEEKKFPKFRTFNPVSNSWSNQQSMSNLGPDGSNALNTVRVLPSPTSDDMFVLMADGSLDLYTVLWDGKTNDFSNKPGASLKKHGIYGSDRADFWYGFAWRIYEYN